MSVSAAQADSFVREVLATGEVWAIRDEEGFPTSTNRSGETAMPFWSKKSRAAKIIDQVPAYAGFQPYRLTLGEFLEQWLPGMERDGLVTGLNWSGKLAIGYDIAPADVRARFDAAKA